MTSGNVHNFLPARQKAQLHVFKYKSHTRKSSVAIGDVCICEEVSAYFVATGEHPVAISAVYRSFRRGWKKFSGTVYVDETKHPTRDSFAFYKDLLSDDRILQFEMRVSPTSPTVASVLNVGFYDMTTPRDSRRLHIHQILAHIPLITFVFRGVCLAMVYVRLSDVGYRHGKSAYNYAITPYASTPGEEHRVLMRISEKFESLIEPAASMLFYVTFDRPFDKGIWNFIGGVAKVYSADILYKHISDDLMSAFMTVKTLVHYRESFLSYINCSMRVGENGGSISGFPFRTVKLLTGWSIDREFSIQTLPDSLELFDPRTHGVPKTLVDDAPARSFFYHNVIVSATLSLYSFGLPPYPMMWLLDWLLYVRYYPDSWKLRLIEGVQRSIERVRAARALNSANKR